MTDTVTPTTIDLTAATGAARALLAAGWKVDRVDQLADGSTERALLHPSGREITAITDGGRDSTDLTLTGLTLDQAAGAVLGAGLAPAAADHEADPECLACRHASSQHVEDHIGCRAGDDFGPCGCPFPQPAKPDYWETLAEDVHRAAVRIATLAGTGRKPTHVSLHIQLAAPGSTDPTVSAVVDTVAAAFGVEAKSTKSAGGYYKHGGRTKLGDLHINPYGYVPAPEVSELEQLRARVAELEAQRAEGGAR